MGKIITIPSWMRSPGAIKADADIPLYADMAINGQNIDCTNIPTALIRNILGEGNNSVFALCTSNLINKWSPYRPGGWKGHGVGGANWLPTGNNQPSFMIDLPTTGKLGDFALYQHLPGRLPTYYDTSPANTIFERGDEQKILIRLKRGYRKPVCEDKGVLMFAWEKVKTWWTLSDTETGLETLVGKSSDYGIIPDILAEPDYFEEKSPSLLLTIGNPAKYLHIRPYYVSGAETPESMIESGQKLITVQAIEIRCTAAITGFTVVDTHPVNKSITVHWSVTRNSGAPTKVVELKVIFTTNEADLGDDFSNSPISSSIIDIGTLQANQTVTGSIGQTISALVSPSEIDNNRARIYLRLQGNLQWSEALANRVFNWNRPIEE